MMIQRWYI